MAISRGTDVSRYTPYRRSKDIGEGQRDRDRTDGLYRVKVVETVYVVWFVMVLVGSWVMVNCGIQQKIDREFFAEQRSESPRPRGPDFYAPCRSCYIQGTRRRLVTNPNG